MAVHGAPIGWRKDKVQEVIGPWKPIKSQMPPDRKCLLMAWETIDCGWLLETGWREGNKYLADNGSREISPHYWMEYHELTDILEAINYPKADKFGVSQGELSPKEKQSLIKRFVDYVKAR